MGCCVCVCCSDSGFLLFVCVCFFFVVRMCSLHDHMQAVCESVVTNISSIVIKIIIIIIIKVGEKDFETFWKTGQKFAENLLII